MASILPCAVAFSTAKLLIVASDSLVFVIFVLPRMGKNKA